MRSLYGLDLHQVGRARYVERYAGRDDDAIAGCGERSPANPYRVTDTFVYGPATLAVARGVASNPSRTISS